jgi:antitoxin (DNA-binding transcriptional repressor) of toxin-antitoxin stability system
MDHYMDMKGYKIERANIGQVKERLSAYVTMVERGMTIQVCRRNRPVAKLVRTESVAVRNRTRLGSAPGSVSVNCDLTAPAIAEKDWGALR